MGGLGAARPRPAPAPPNKREGEGEGGAGGKKKKEDVQEDGDARVSKHGKTAKAHLAELKEKVAKHGGPDIVKLGWTCTLEEPPPANGESAAGAPPQLEHHFVSPDGGRFTSRKEVMKQLGLKKKEKKEGGAQRFPRPEAYQRARNYFKQKLKDEAPPVKIADISVRSWGKIDFERPAFHDDKHLWPVGFKSSWKDEERSTLYESEVLDGALTGEVGVGIEDGPIFLVTVKKDGARPLDHFGKTPKEAWRKAMAEQGQEDSKVEHFGLSVAEIRKRVEGIKHADLCKGYRFMEQEPPADHGKGSKDKGSAKKKGAGGKDKAAKDKAVDKATKVKGEGKIEKPKKAGQGTKKETAAAAKEMKNQLREQKKKDKEEQAARAKEEAAAKRKAHAEEMSRKRKEQEEERKWEARFPLEDLALGVEAEALREAEASGHDTLAQRAAARASVEAIERGFGTAAALQAAKAAAARIDAGGTAEEAMDAGIAVAEDWEGGDGDDGGGDRIPPPVVDDVQVCKPGVGARMLFTENDSGGGGGAGRGGGEGAAAGGGGGKGSDKWYTGWVSKVSEDGKQCKVSFFEGEDVDVAYPDPDMQLVPQGELRLPHGAPLPERASSLAADAHAIIAFVESFQKELQLPKGGLTDLIQTLHNPASGAFLGDLYYSLMRGSMAAAQEQHLTVPPQWYSEATLTSLTWPEVLRRWLICGPYAEVHRRNCPEALAAANTLSSSSCAGTKTLPEGHVAMLLCLLDSVMDHSEVKGTLDTRVEHCDELRRNWAQKVKEFKEHEKQLMNDRILREAALQAGDRPSKEEPEPEPKLEIPPELLAGDDERVTPAQAADRQRKIDDMIENHQRAHNQWEKKQESRARQEEREEERRVNDEKRFYERHAKAENDLHNRLSKGAVRYTPLGMDRYSNRYWWYPSEKGRLYIEPAQADRLEEGSDSQERSFQWRMYSGEEPIKALRSTLNEKGLRECELAQGIDKAFEKERFTGDYKAIEDIEVVQYTDPQERERVELAISTDVFNAVHLEGKNIAEVLQKGQAAEANPPWLEDWTQRLMGAADCSGMSELLLEVEDRITDSLLTKKGKKAKAAAEAEANDGGGEGGDGEKKDSVWLDNTQEYNEYVGKKVRRSVLGDDGKPAGAANGTITGWLPARLSDFYSKETGQKASLWHVVFDDEDIGEEDLEEHEVRAAITAYQALAAALSTTGPSGLPAGWKRIPRDDQGHYQYVAPDGNTFRSLADAKAHAQTSAKIGEELAFADEGNVDMVEAGNKPSRRSLWTSSLQRTAWRSECGAAGSSGAIVRTLYSAAVLTESVCRVFSVPRDTLSSAPRRPGKKRTRADMEVIGDLGFTDSGRKCKKVSYREDSDDEEFDD